ncbi:hypothetical protein CEXT_200151 [Caerostris extrusa]|uniref:Uncharacterized protein n=1 Tax=Caerostris extrusa TaxID=172846 RepID=A0AAV4Y978_CAEEX|nr:hypothetical protein CEXT_200151 [Caerostris extrusa]
MSFCSLRQTQHLPKSSIMFVDNQFYYAMTETPKEVEDDSSSNVGSSTSKCRLFIEADTAFANYKNQKPSIMFVDNEFYCHGRRRKRK